MWNAVLCFVAGGCAILCAQLPSSPKPKRPRFEDFAVRTKLEPSGKRAPLELMTSFDKGFRTLLMAASKEPPDFAGKYRLALWGCGSGYATGALIDLERGMLHRLPLDFEAYPDLRDRGWLAGCNMLGPGIHFQIDSRLLVVQCPNWDQDTRTPFIDTHYFVWTGVRFDPLLRIPKDPNPPFREGSNE